MLVESSLRRLQSNRRKPVKMSTERRSNKMADSSSRISESSVLSLRKFQAHCDSSSEKQLSPLSEREYITTLVTSLFIQGELICSYLLYIHTDCSTDYFGRGAQDDHLDFNNNNVHLSCAHQRPERSQDTY